jgi:hypothetical protein
MLLKYAILARGMMMGDRVMRYPAAIDINLDDDQQLDLPVGRRRMVPII